MSVQAHAAPGRPTHAQGEAFADDAFTPYTHHDRPVAAGIQSGPHRIGRRAGQLRALRVFREKVTDLAAPIHGKPKPEPAGEDLREQRRFWRLRRAAVIGLVVLTVLAVAAAAIAVVKQGEAIRQRMVNARIAFGRSPGVDRACELATPYVTRAPVQSHLPSEWETACRYAVWVPTPCEPCALAPTRMFTTAALPEWTATGDRYHRR